MPSGKPGIELVVFSYGKNASSIASFRRTRQTGPSRRTFLCIGIITGLRSARLAPDSSISVKDIAATPPKLAGKPEVILYSLFSFRITAKAPSSSVVTTAPLKSSGM